MEATEGSEGVRKEMSRAEEQDSWKESFGGCELDDERTQLEDCEGEILAKLDILHYSLHTDGIWYLHRSPQSVIDLDWDHLSDHLYYYFCSFACYDAEGNATVGGHSYHKET